MKLHEDEEAFQELIVATAQHIGLPEVHVEKDYWVTKALKNLSESDYARDAVFKGGTSLSKAYRLIDRFSEDIDLAIFSEGRSRGQ
ncbi:nucleotidyl transferase AbiEii/AbiGii toxin family protein [Emcibacter nanhaiensis]|uniref:Nucleotidyl transferase AbiEii/AbiGii toxin family protein n=1 Tax=Emcibacter nanhaiensis TaxID=1505037 RepID=A0A501PHS8_9PROT|nr:nucleotidyl transferase AbiEii/AbiGii toxin family protein [Emcibacter nanhaiensis]